jgi:hypothetical protein
MKKSCLVIRAVLQRHVIPMLEVLLYMCVCVCVCVYVCVLLLLLLLLLLLFSYIDALMRVYFFRFFHTRHSDGPILQ